MSDAVTPPLSPRLEAFIREACRALPSHLQKQYQTQLEIRELVANRMAEEGGNLDTALAFMGSPLEVAESVLQTHQGVTAGWGNRIAAKAYDFCLIGIAILVPVAVLGALGIDPFIPDAASDFHPSLGLYIYAAMVVLLYGSLSEWRWGATPGKRICQLAVVQESGARISLVQALFRNLPLALQMFWLDSFFALFNPQKQRLFEKLSHTRTIRTK